MPTSISNMNRTERNREAAKFRDRGFQLHNIDIADLREMLNGRRFRPSRGWSDAYELRTPTGDTFGVVADGSGDLVYIFATNGGRIPAGLRHAAAVLTATV